MRYVIMKQRGKIITGGLRSLGRELQKEAWQDAGYVILVDENTFQFCLPSLVSQVEPFQEAEFVEVPVGEECKSLEVASQIWQTLMERVSDRNTVIVNLGGGCVCDLGGFVAAGFKRGIRHINIPTTLLAMVDASIGGKTAVNFGDVKNMIGHFYMPEAVCIDTTFLATLPQSELLSGKVEMIKTAAVADPALYRQLLQSADITKQQIVAVAKLKNRIVKEDFNDHGIRQILNFGHTFGHAVEAYSHLSHGEAVGVGMLMAMYLSTKKIGLDVEIYQSYKAWATSHLKLPAYTLKDVPNLLYLIHQDKKSESGRARCVLLRQVGAAMIGVEVPDEEIVDAILSLGR